MRFTGTIFRPSTCKSAMRDCGISVTYSLVCFFSIMYLLSYLVQICYMNMTFLQYYTFIDFNEVDIRIYLPIKVLIHRGR